MKNKSHVKTKFLTFFQICGDHCLLSIDQTSINGIATIFEDANGNDFSISYMHLDNKFEIGIRYDCE